MGIEYGKGLKKLRKNYGKTQGDLANETSIAQAYISAIETGRRTPTDETIRKLIEPFGIGYVDFLIDYCGIKRAGAPEGETAAEGKARLQREEIELIKQERQENIDDQALDEYLSNLVSLEEGAEKGFSLNGNPIESYEQNAINAFIESMKAAREKQIDFYRQGVEQGKKEIHDNP